MNPASAAGAGRCLTEEQLYSKRYYASRVKPHVDAEIAGRDVDRKTLISIRARHTRRVFEAETEEVKLEIRQEKESNEEKKKEMIEMMGRLTNANGDEEYTPEEYAR